MRTDLSHLPEQKRAELELAVRILFEEFEDATKLTTDPRRKLGRILKVVLFGSYARGDWVDDPASGYKSDYDLLVVVNQDELTDIADYWVKADEHLLRAYQVTKQLSAPVNFIVHTLSDVNAQVKRGRYFFADIAAQGIALYDSEGARFAQPEPLDEQEAKAEAQGYFDKWFGSATEWLEMANTAISKGQVGDWPNNAAFLLHQTAERLYVCVLLVLTLYSPKSHKLNFLRSMAEDLDTRLIKAWPRDDKFSRRCFELLRRAYVEARYSAHYKISTDEIEWLGQRLEALMLLVRSACLERLEGGAGNVQSNAAGLGDYSENGSARKGRDSRA